MDRRQFLNLLALGSTLPTLGFYSGLASAKRKESPSVSAPTITPPSIETLPDDEWLQFPLVACGSAAIAMTRHIDKSRFGLSEIIAIDTSSKALRYAKHADKRILISTDDGKKPDSAMAAWSWADKARNEIEKAIANPYLVIIVTGLGGSAGTGICNVVNQVALTKGALTVAFATMPFSFEDSQRQSNGQAGYKALVANSSNVLAVSSEHMLRELGPNMTFSDMLSASDAALRNYLWHVSGCITRQGIVGIDFEDVRTVLDFRNEGYSSRIGWGEATGSNRGASAARKALSHPMLQLKDANSISGVSVSMRANRKSLKMREINQAMNEVKARCPDSTHIVFSADYDESLDDWMQISIITNGKHSDFELDSQG